MAKKIRVLKAILFLVLVVLAVCVKPLYALMTFITLTLLLNLGILLKYDETKADEKEVEKLEDIKADAKRLGSIVK